VLALPAWFQQQLPPHSSSSRQQQALVGCASAWVSHSCARGCLVALAAAVTLAGLVVCCGPWGVLLQQLPALVRRQLLLSSTSRLLMARVGQGRAGQVLWVMQQQM
jgi:hypothetical protein